MSMYYPPKRPDEIYHWGIEKGKEKKDHKYFNRILLGAKNGKNLYRYFYDKAAWDAYNNGKKEAKKVISSATKSASNLIAKSPAKNLVESGKNLFNNLFKSKEEKEAEAKTKRDAEVRAADKAIAREEEKRHDPHQRSKADNSKRTEEYKTNKEKLDQYKKEQEELRKYREEKSKEQEANAEALTKREEAIEAARQKRLNAKIETQPQGERKYNYVARIKNPNGEGWLYFYEESTYRSWLETNNSDEAKLVDAFGLKKSSATEEEDMAEINEDWTGQSPNCWSCSIAYDLRRRGYNVEAIDAISGESSINYLKVYKEVDEDEEFFKTYEKSSNYMLNTRIHENDEEKAKQYYSDENNRKELASRFIKGIEKGYPEGSSGLLSCRWYEGGGHVTNWEIKNGEFLIHDCQINKTFKGQDAIDYIKDCGGLYSFANQDYVMNCIPYRTDNLTLNVNNILNNSNDKTKNKKVSRSMVNKN